MYRIIPALVVSVLYVALESVFGACSGEEVLSPLDELSATSISIGLCSWMV